MHYICTDKLLSDSKARTFISQQVYVGLLRLLKHNGDIPRQSIRYILCEKDSPACSLAQELCKLFDGWVTVDSISKEDIEYMGRDSSNWPESLRSLRQKLGASRLIYVDDGINTGWTLDKIKTIYQIVMQP